MDPSDLPLRLREHPYAVGIQALCAHYWDAIRTKKVFGRRYLQYYQKLLIQEQLPSFKTLTREFFQELDTAFKMNVSLGLILLNNESQELSFFHPNWADTSILSNPVIVRNYRDWRRVYKLLEASDLMEVATLSRPGR